MIPQLERRITIPEDMYVALGEIAAKERQKIKDPLFKKMITEKSLAQHIIRNEVLRRGCKLMKGWVKKEGSFSTPTTIIFDSGEVVKNDGKNTD